MALCTSATTSVVRPNRDGEGLAHPDLLAQGWNRGFLPLWGMAACQPILAAAGDKVQWGAVEELAQEEGVPIWGTRRWEAHRWQRTAVACLQWRWMLVRGRRRGQSRSRRGRWAARWRGEARRWFWWAGELPEEAGTGAALMADEELSIGYFSLVMADDSRETHPLRMALGARGRRLGMPWHRGWSAMSGGRHCMGTCRVEVECGRGVKARRDGKDGEW
jgi:hypothetical protein